MTKVVVSDTVTRVSVDEDIVTVSPSSTDVEVITAGTQGPAGVNGTGDKNYIQPFSVASSVTVNHNLSKYPAVSIVDSAYDEVEGFVEHLNTNQLRVDFSAPFSGTVICN